MTTIACDGRSMAGDGQRESCRTIATMEAIKVHRLKDGSLFGASGKAAFGIQMREWLDKGAEGDAPKTDDPSAFLVLKPDGTLWQGGECGHMVQISPPFAIGSGMDFAIAAMDLGHSPQKAVSVAAKRDPGTGGAISTLHLVEQLRSVA